MEGNHRADLRLPEQSILSVCQSVSRGIPQPSSVKWRSISIRLASACALVERP